MYKRKFISLSILGTFAFLFNPVDATGVEDPRAILLKETEFRKNGDKLNSETMNNNKVEDFVNAALEENGR